MKIKVSIKDNEGNTLSFSDFKNKAKNVVNNIKEDKNVQKAQEKAKDFVNLAADFADKAIGKVEDYIDQKLADEKNVGLDDITEDFFENDEEESYVEEEEEIFVKETEDGINIIIFEPDDEIDNNFEDDGFKPDGIIIICDSDIFEEELISFEEFLDEIVDFEETDKKPDISNETECFLEAIEYFVSDVSRKAFKAVVQLPKITYDTVIDAIKEDFPEMSKNEIKKMLKVDFDNWVNVRYPDIKEDCVNYNCIMLMKYWAKKFKEF